MPPPSPPANPIGRTPTLFAGSIDSSKPFAAVAGDPGSGILLLCDHAGNAVPAAYADLGLPAAEFARHIAYDPGAGALTVALAARLRAPAIGANFCRLLIDANRGEDDPTLIMRLSDGAIVAGNFGVDAAERRHRIAAFHAPYQSAIAAAIDRARASGHPPILVSVHSFTPVMRGRPRPWHAGVLSDRDKRAATPLLAALRADAALVVGDNEPYAGGLDNDTLDRHGTRQGLANVLIEIRQDLIADAAGIAAWADRLAPALAAINRLPGIHDVNAGTVYRALG